jgi:hypothetical protein
MATAVAKRRVRSNAKPVFLWGVLVSEPGKRDKIVLDVVDKDRDGGPAHYAEIMTRDCAGIEGKTWRAVRLRAEVV